MPAAGKTKDVLDKFYKKLDGVLMDKVIPYCEEIIDHARSKMKDKDGKSWTMLGLKASEALMKKAPDRIANPDGSSLFSQLLNDLNGDSTRPADEDTTAEQPDSGEAESLG